MTQQSKVGDSRKSRAKTGGRKKGTPNKVTGQLKDMILAALDEAHPKGAVEYLKSQAAQNPTAFLTLVGKVLPMQIDHSGDIALTMKAQRDAAVERALRADT